MLGEVVGEEHGKVTVYRVLPPEGGASKVEVSFQASGTLHGAVPVLVSVRSAVLFEPVLVATAPYHRFLEWILSRVSVTALLQRGYSHQRNVRECTDEA